MRQTETVTPTRRRYIDYVGLASLYNTVEVGGMVDLEMKVSNITNFRDRVASSGLAAEVDFEVFNLDGSTYLRKLSETQFVWV